MTTRWYARQIGVFILVILGPCVAFSFQENNVEKNVPTLTSYVTDETGTLTSQESGALEARLKTYEDTTSNQIVVLVVNSVPGADVFSYSMSVAEKNKVGQKGKDNGIIFLVDVGDHKTWFQVGYGLEGVVTDAYASYISNEIVVPEFRSGDYYTGIDKGITALQSLIAGTFHADVNRRDRNPLRGVNPFFFFIFLVPLFRLLFWSRRYSATSRGVRRSGMFFPPFGGFGGGGFGGFGSGGGFGGGGGFSGGGGSFGGGGAGGSW